MALNNGEVGMTSIEQAALLLLSMGEECAAKIIGQLDPEQVQMISQAMAKPDRIGQHEARFVLNRFFTTYGEQSGISGASRQYLEKTLELALGRELSQNLMDSIYGNEIRLSMQRLQWLEPEGLARVIRHEHPQMQAVFLAFLPPASASVILQSLPKSLQDDILLRIGQLTDISKEAVEELEQLIQRCLVELAEGRGSRVSGSKQAADMLNTFQGDSGELMELLKLQNETVAQSIEDNMFDFVVLGRQRDDVLQVITQEVSDKTLAVALKGADAKVKQAIMAAMPKRMVQNLESEMETLGGVPVSRVEQAKADVMAKVKQLQHDGEIELQLFEERVVE